MVYNCNIAYDNTYLYSEIKTSPVEKIANLKAKQAKNHLVVGNTNDTKPLPLVNEIFLVDPHTNQVHSVIRQVIPSGDHSTGEIAVQELRQHLENNSGAEQPGLHHGVLHAFEHIKHQDEVILNLIRLCVLFGNI